MKIFEIAIVGFFFVSCSYQPSRQQKEFYGQVSKGEATALSCRGSDYNRYIAYLPTKFSIDHSFPVLFCFDPHADARLAISLFRDYAEEHGMIIIASATLQNGQTQEEIVLYLNQLYRDVRDKLWVDTTRIFAAGFSGGARVAGIFSQLAPVAGLISCSAGYYPMGKCVPVILIAGTYDMNYLETRFSDNNINTALCKHCFLTFEGPHQWPPRSSLYRAMDILQIWSLDSVEFNRSAFVKERLEKEKQDLLNHLKLYTPDSLWHTIEAMRIFLSIYGPIADTKPIRQSYDSLLQQKSIVSLLDSKIAAEKYEEEQQEIIRQAMGSRPLEWWITTLGQWQKQQGKDTEMLAVHKRLLAYVSLLSYSYAQAAIRQGNWNAVGYILSIYGMADPENADYHYFMACRYAHENKVQQALEELTIALRAGIPLAKAMNDPLLSSLKPYLKSQ
ncbi:MAG: hypothetical protein ACP5PS_00960 [Bacteroidales bacterium]